LKFIPEVSDGIYCHLLESEFYFNLKFFQAHHLWWMLFSMALSLE